jgi:hypothetical protein
MATYGDMRGSGLSAPRAVSGTNPGHANSRYSGSVVVTRTGDTYRVVWTIAGQQYEGTGVGNNDFIAVSYRSGNQTGLAHPATPGGASGAMRAEPGSDRSSGSRDSDSQHQQADSLMHIFSPDASMPGAH